MNMSDTSNPEDSRIQDEEAVQMIIDLDAECGDYSKTIEAEKFAMSIDLNRVSGKVVYHLLGEWKGDKHKWRRMLKQIEWSCTKQAGKTF